MSKVAKELDQLRQKDVKALQLQLVELQTALQKARVDLAFGRLPKTTVVSQSRRQIARLKTVLQEKELAHA